MINLRGADKHLKDIMNPEGMFEGGERLKEYSEKNVLAFSGRLLKDFFKRRNIKDMFGKKPSLPQDTSSVDTTQMYERPQAVPAVSDKLEGAESVHLPATDLPSTPVLDEHSLTPMPSQPSRTASPDKKRKASESTPKATKKAKAGTKAVAEKSVTNGQQSLKGFFQSKAPKPSFPLVDAANDKNTDTKVNVDPHDSGRSRRLELYGKYQS